MVWLFGVFRDAGRAGLFAGDSVFSQWVLLDRMNSRVCLKQTGLFPDEYHPEIEPGVHGFAQDHGRP
jgi:hypothetical protein